MCRERTLHHNIAFITLALIISPAVLAEEFRDLSGMLGLNDTIEVINDLESRRDPKCAATASRLEDFMFGTPLTDRARNYQISRQKHLVRLIWESASRMAEARKDNFVRKQDIKAALEQMIQTEYSVEGDITVRLADKYSMLLKYRDIRQYGSVAYALRAILSAQQDASVVDRSLLPLDKSAISELKHNVDLVTLALLKRADFEARQQDQYELNVTHLESVWRRAFGALPVDADDQRSAVDRSVLDYPILRGIIQQKVRSYEAYNNIATPVFLRNIQVYFARHPWPSDEKKSLKLKSHYNQAMVFYAMDLYQGAEQVAKQNGHAFIRPEDVQKYVGLFIPVVIDRFEDAVFFPRLPKASQVKLASYDMDAFRDSGLHWKYLEAALDEPEFDAVMEPDPFAAELLVESISQFGVLVLRIAGDIAAGEETDYLNEAHLASALAKIQKLVDLHANTPRDRPVRQQIISADEPSGATDETGYFTDVTEGSGVNYRHRMSDWLSRMIRSYTIRDKEVAVLAVPPAFGGSGVAAEDIDQDGLMDLLLVGGSGNRLYLNRGGGRFTDVTKSSGLDWMRESDGLPGEARQPIIADFDNDGIQDVFISYAGDSHRLYRGIGDGRFSDVTPHAGLGGDDLIGGPAVAVDYDNDGLLDLYIAYFGQYDQGIGPTLARHNVNGLPNRLFRNTGNFVFKDVTRGSGTANTGWTQAASHTDINRDGWQDLIVGNDFGINAYLLNQQDGTFRDIAEQLGTDKPSFTMNVGIGDINDDLYPDFYISNIVTMDKDQKYINPEENTPMKLDSATLATLRVVEANDLFLSLSDNKSLINYLRSSLVGRGYSSTGWSWGADFIDFDNDTDSDLYVTNGMNDFAVYSAQNPYFKDQQGNKRNVVFPESQRDSNVFFENTDGRLVNASRRSGADLLGNSRAVVYFDMDNDGDLDMVLNNYESDATVYRNNSERYNNNWLSIKLVGDPDQQSNRDAVGARIIVSTENDKRLWREVHSSVAYLSMHPKQQHFGLGKSGKADVRVEWPNGRISNFDGLASNRVYLVEQAENRVRPLTDSR